MIRAIGIGDNVCDKYLHLKKMFPGGQALNFAVYCRQKGHVAAYLGVFGSDKVAEHVTRVLDLLEIDTSRCRRVQGENGYAVVDILEGERVFVTSNKGGVLRTNPIVLDDDDLDYLTGYDVIHTSNNSRIDSQLPALAKVPAILSYDFSNSWTDEERAKKICPYSDIGFLSCSGLPDDEVKAILRQMHSLGTKILVATRGSLGAVLYNGFKYYEHHPEPVKAIDTLGAGDSFAAGFLMTYIKHTLKGTPEPNTLEMDELLTEALRNGAVLSSETCMTDGAFGYGVEITNTLNDENIFRSVNENVFVIQYN